MIQLNKIIVLIFNIIILSVYYVNTFNFSPKPNMIFREPNLKNFLPKTRSSYFGYSINLRTSSLIIGAPRAQSNEEAQRKVNETGVIYKCSLVNGKCSPYVFDKFGNRYFEHNDYTWNSEKKDLQWLGATIDGGSRDNERLIVCAPRACADAVHEYLMHGICYWVSDTISDQPQNIKTISPLRLKTLQVRETEIPGFQSKKSFYYMFGESGLSLHWSDVNEEILIGAPGIHTWKGSIVRYRPLEPVDIGGLSKRDIMGMRVSRQSTKEYTSDVPNPELWEQPNDSYFGYSVSSGTFDNKNKSKILYVASAPQANKQSGEVYIFDIERVNQQFTIRKDQTFHGNQFGEFFGYLVLSEDINKDGLTDLLVSAPLYAVDTSYDKGAVYLFMNRGNFNFDKQIVISPSDEPGRFGSTMTKLGDINHDGFNDIAIGAPFDKSGSVFIYLGGPNGLREKPSQVLNISELNNYKKNQMFGHGLSRGVDIDFNGFNDFAVGAPGLEAVFLYKSYPVVKILASISSTSREIKMDQTKLQIKACFLIETSSYTTISQEINIMIKADQQLKRVTFENGGNEFSFISTASLTEQCKIYDANVKFNLRNIFKPIEVEMHYKLNNNIPDSENFCDTCAVVDPIDDTVTKQKIIFSTGCKNEVCVADLKLTSKIEPIFILGSSRTMTIEFNVLNAGEAAYLPQLNISSSNNMPFAKIPSNCVEKEMMLLCDLFRGHPLLNGNKDSLSIVFDTSNIYGTNMMIIAEVLSAGKEQNRGDNIVNTTILLKEFSSIEAVGSSNKAIISLEEQKGFAEFINNYEIKNIGPSSVENIELILSIPVSYILSDVGIRIPLVSFNNISLNAEYGSYQLRVEYYENNLLIKPTEKLSIKEKFATYTDTTINQEETTDHYQELSNNILSRRRRAIEEKLIQQEYSKISKKNRDKSISEDLTGILPLDRTILFNCNDPEETLCIQAVVRAYNFRAHENEPISLTLKYKINLDEINKILIEDNEFFVITTGLSLNKIGDEKGETINIHKSIPHNIISKHQLHSTPFWVIIMAVLAGILVLALLSYGLYKMGFFKRTKKEELASLTQNNQNKSDESEDDDQ